MKLSIVIPTKNRVKRAEITALSVYNIFKDNPEVEVLLSDSSKEQSAKPAPGIKLLNCLESFDLAEDHFFWCMSRVSGEYIWILGDDDSVNREGALKMFSMLKDGPDFLLFNQNVIMPYGTIEPGVIQCSHPDRIVSMEDYVLRAGLWFGLAGVSNAVYKTPTEMERAAFKMIYDLNPIYSHVIWYLYTFKDRPFKYINTPLVSYSISPTRWNEVCSNLNVSISYPWTIGYMRQIKFLRSVYGDDHFRDILGAEWGGTRCKTSAFSANLFHQDMRDISTNKNECRRITEAEAKEYIEFIIGEDSLFSNIFPMGIIEETMAAKLLDHYIMRPLLSNFVEKYRFFNIYKLHGEYLALATPEHDEVNGTIFNNTEKFLSDLTPTTIPFCIREGSIDQLRYKVNLALEQMCNNLVDCKRNSYEHKKLSAKKIEFKGIPAPLSKWRQWLQKIFGKNAFVPPVQYYRRVV